MAPPGPRRITFGNRPLYSAVNPSSFATNIIELHVVRYFIWPGTGCGPCRLDIRKKTKIQKTIFILIDFIRTFFPRTGKKHHFFTKSINYSLWNTHTHTNSNKNINFKRKETLTWILDFATSIGIFAIDAIVPDVKPMPTLRRNSFVGSYRNHNHFQLNSFIG